MISSEMILESLIVHLAFVQFLKDKRSEKF